MELTITVPHGILNAILDHARSESPSECCGLLSGLDNVVDLYHPLRNNSSEPDQRYFASPEELFEAMREMRARGRSLLAIYHSHPRGQAYPSQTDVELAFYPHVAYIIQSLDPLPDIRAFKIEDRMVSEMKIDIVDAQWMQIAQTASGLAASMAAGGSAGAQTGSGEVVFADRDFVEAVPEVEAVSEPGFIPVVTQSETEKTEKITPIQRVIQRLKKWF